MWINGTMFLTCVDDSTKVTPLIIGLCVGLPVFVVIIICACAFHYHYKQCKKYNQPIFQWGVPSGVNPSPSVPKHEHFLTDGGYIRRIAHVLEVEDSIPNDVQEWMETNEPITWAKLQNDPHIDFVERAARVMVVLFKCQADMEHVSTLDTFYKWRGKIVETCGGEWAERIMGRVETLLNV